jgi:hypothetical protein
MNPHTPLEIFLPPNSIPELANINLLMAKNMDGLNSGVFALRVHPWSVSILSTILAYPIFEAQRSRTDQFRDQSAFQWLLQLNLKSPLFNAPFKGTESWAEVPMCWFNSMPFNNAFTKKWDWVFSHNLTDDLFDKGTNEVFNDGHGGHVRPWKVMQGDMVVHFAGADRVRVSWMRGWLERAEQYLPEWNNATKQVELKDEAKTFWKGTADRIAREREGVKLEAANAAPKAAEASKTEVQPGSVSEKLLTDTTYGGVPAHVGTLGRIA